MICCAGSRLSPKKTVELYLANSTLKMVPSVGVVNYQVPVASLGKRKLKLIFFFFLNAFLVTK